MEAVDSSLDEIVRAAARVGQGRQGRVTTAARLANVAPRGAARTAVARGRGSRAAGQGSFGAAVARVAARGVARGGVVKKTARKSSVVVVGWPGPSRNQGGRSDTLSQMAPDVPTECKIGDATDVKAAAGFLCSLIRARTPVPVLSMTESSSFTAINALGLAHQFLQDDNLDLYCQVDFPDYSQSHQSCNMHLHLFIKKKRTDLSRVSQQILCRADSIHKKVAGAIANGARESEMRRLVVSTVGPQATMQGMKAIFCARHYLREEGLDLSVVPELEAADNGKTVINLFLIVHAIGKAV